jgi:hypothetical protein
MYPHTQSHCHQEARSQSLGLHSRHRQSHMGANGRVLRTHPHLQSHCHQETRSQSIELNSHRRQLHMNANEPGSHAHPHTQSHCHQETRSQSIELHSRRRQLHMGANGLDSRIRSHYHCSRRTLTCFYTYCIPRNDIMAAFTLLDATCHVMLMDLIHTIYVNAR